MAGWIFTTIAWCLVATGVFLAWRFGWRDPGKGMRRCPRCGYDLSATSGLRCSECGYEAKSERRLHRRRVRRRWVLAGLLVALTSWVPFKWPEYQRLAPLRSGVLAFVPKTVLVVAWPWIMEWQVASYEKPNAWWAKSDPSTFMNLQEAIRPSERWRWQRVLLGWSLRRAFLRRDSVYVFNAAADLMFDAKDTPLFAKEAYLQGFCHAPAQWGLRFVRERDYWYPFPEGAAHAVAAELERRPERIYSNDHTLWWISHFGANTDAVARAVLNSGHKPAALRPIAQALATGAFDPDTAQRLLEIVREAPTPDTARIAQLLQSADLSSPAFESDIVGLLQGKDMYAAGILCAAIARRGVATDAVRHALERASCNDQADAKHLALITLRSLDGRLAEIPALIEQLHRDAVQDPDLFSASMRLSGLYRLGMLPAWPRDLRWLALWAAIDKRWVGSLIGDCYSATLALVREFGDDSRTVAAFAGEFKNDLAYSWVALDEYAKRGPVPKSLLEAAKQLASSRDAGFQEMHRKRFAAMTSIDSTR